MPALRRAAALLALFTSPLGAQALRVRATEEVTGRPLSGAIADVIDERGESAAQALLREDGTRFVPLPRDGTFTVRVRRIGYEPFVSPPVTVRGADTVSVVLRVPARRVTLSAMRVTGSRRCAREASAAGAVATLLEEARKALTATALARTDARVDSGDASLVSRTFRRRVSVDGDLLDVSVALPRRTDTARPFTAIAARALSDSGYVRLVDDGVTFYGPDAEVLLSDEFLRDHCFEAIAGRGTSDGLLGVRFTPAPGRRVSDIAGTLWMDSTSAELRYLDFWYATNRLPVLSLGEGRSGGRVVFESTRGGRWVVSAWHLRMPRFQTTVVSRATTPSGYDESGGVVSGIARPDGALPRSLAAVLAPYEALTQPVRIAGMVFDSLLMRPLAGARLALTPTLPADASSDDEHLAVGEFAAVTDSSGRYALDSIPAGTYHLALTSPPHDSAGVPLPAFDVRLAPGSIIGGDLATPSRGTLAEGCNRTAVPLGGGDGGLVFGTVRAEDSGRPVQNVDVYVSWVDVPTGPGVRRDSAVLVDAVTDRAGSYRVCGVPPGALASVRAVTRADSTPLVVDQLSPLGVLRRDLTIAVDGRAPSAEPTGMLRGVVRGPDGAPLRDVLVTLDRGAPNEPPRSATTDGRGEFRLFGLPVGTRTFVATRAGFQAGRFTAELRNHNLTTVALRMDVIQRLVPF